MANTLFLRLEAPLQSWGEDSQWSVRRTAPEPTKSGIVGLLACAMGWADDERIRSLSRHIHIGVRCDIPGIPAPLEDYHTIGGGYDKNEPQLLTAKGNFKYIPNTKMPHTEPTWRYYLCDASFLVAVLSADENLITELADSIQNPQWTIYLGRKSCVPARPPFDGIGNYETLEEALEDHSAKFLDNDPRAVEKHPRVILECGPGEGIRRRDQIRSRSYRIFDPRYSKEDLFTPELKVEYLKGT